MALIYNATFDKNTRKLSFEDRAGNEVYSFTVPERAPVDDPNKPLTFKATQDGSTVTLTKSGSPSGSFQTSRDGGSTWTNYTLNSAITLNTGDEVSFRARYDRTSAQDYSVYFQFKMTGKIEAWHNVVSMYCTSYFDMYESVIEYAFYRMFEGCTSLTKAPALPATTLADYCYSSMFKGCTSLTEAPVLPATTLANNCYQNMFNGCTSLTEAPVLPATTLANYCYQNMFNGCRKLAKAPVLPVTTLAGGCYYHMFNGCTSLTEAPALPATTLASNCYNSMFYGCTSLTKAPALPATTLANYCYQNMFNGCTSLTKSPELPATTLNDFCYYRMFYGCSNLNEVRCQMPSSYNSSQISSYAEDWLYNVSSTGTFYTNADANWSTGASGIPMGWTRVPGVAPATSDITKPLTFKATQDGSTVTLTKSGSPTGSFQTSRDGGNTWSDYTIGTAITLNTDDEVSFRAKAYRTKDQSDKNYFSFQMTGKIEAWHNVMSMYRTSDFATNESMVKYAFYNLFGGCTSLTKAPALPVTTLARACYYRMFEGCTSLTKAPELPATTLAAYCYSNMFKGCTSLAKAPALPATTLNSSCYEHMFNGCTSLTEAPELPATTLATHCYWCMFYGCASLTKAPALPATTLEQSCYSTMFYGCTSLTKAPALPATTLEYYCYQNMFNGCTSLTEAPELPATTLATECYSNMFKGCTSLAKAPALPATTLAGGCYYHMFDGCTSLTEAPALPATTLANNCYNSMFYGCTSLTKAPALPATTLTISCYSTMFNGCTSLTEAPELPATTLVEDCYSNMFDGCTSLTKAPELPATTLANYCYWEMFRNCSSLNEVRCKMSSSYSSSSIGSTYAKNWLFNVSPTGTFYTNADAKWPSGSTSGIPTGWTRVNEGAPTVDDLTKPLTFRATQNGSTVSLKKNGLPESAHFQTSRDGGNTWEDYTIGTAITLNTGDEVSFRARYDREFEQSDSNYVQFNMTGKIEAWHNVMSLYRTSDFATYESVMKFAFHYLFKGCTSLTKAPRLPATKLAQSCYYHMFYGCTSLTKAPYLPATSLAETCYKGMFIGCTSLTEVPVLSATRLGIRCYWQMFDGCSSLNKVHCHIPSSYSNTDMSVHADSWLSNVASTGTFYTNADANWSTGSISGIPEGWTRVND